MEALRTMSHGESEAITAPASGMNRRTLEGRVRVVLSRLLFAACVQVRFQPRRGPTLPSSGRA